MKRTRLAVALIAVALLLVGAMFILMLDDPDYADDGNSSSEPAVPQPADSVHSPLAVAGSPPSVGVPSATERQPLGSRKQPAPAETHRPDANTKVPTVTVLPGDGEGASETSVTSEEPPAIQEVGYSTIEGRVRDEAGEPVAGAQVEARIDAKKRGRRTNSAEGGKFSFEALPDGHYLLFAVKDGLEGSAGPVPVLGETTQYATIFLGASASISGRVIEEESREGVPGIAVDFFDASRRISATAYSYSDGRFHTAVLAPAVYAAWLQKHPNYFTERSSRMNVAVAGGESKEDVVLTIRKGVSLRGVVLNAAGEPVAEATVLLDDMLSGIGGVKGETESDESGRFVFRGQNPVGRFVARAVHPDYGFGQSAPVLAQRGGSIPLLEVRLMGGGTVQGRLVTNEGQGVAGLDVWLAKTDTWWRHIPGTRTTSDPDGRFSIANVGPGDYQFEVVTAAGDVGLTRLIGPAFTVTEEEVPQLVEVSLGNGPEGFVEGRVTSPEGEPLPRVEVLAGSLNPRLSGGQNSTGDDGRYRIDGLGPAATVSIEARGFRLGRFRKEVANVPVNSSGVDFVLGKMASLSGRVIDGETGEGVTSFHVAGPIVDMDIESPDGSFKIGQLQVASGEFRFSAQGYQTAVYDAGPISEGAEISGVVITLKRAEWLEGSVTAAATGLPVEGARVKSLQPGEEADHLDHPMSWTSADPFTDAQGRFFLPGKPLGETNSFVVWHQDYKAAVVRDSIERKFAIALQPK